MISPIFYYFIVFIGNTTFLGYCFSLQGAMAAVGKAVKDGGQLSAATLDKLEEVAPGKLQSLMHDNPDWLADQ